MGPVVTDDDVEIAVSVEVACGDGVAGGPLCAEWIAQGKASVSFTGRDVRGILGRAIVDEHLVRLRPVATIGHDHVEVVIAVYVRERQRSRAIAPEAK